LTNDLSILPPCPLARYEPSEYIYTEIEGTGEAFGGAAGRIIPRPRTPRSYKEGMEGEGGRGLGLGDEVNIAPSCASAAVENEPLAL
jgi:hypothetical protein